MAFEEAAPAFQFYANDRLAELMELDMAARGAWISCVVKLWRSGPMEEIRLERIAGADNWKTIRFLFAFYSITDGIAEGNQSDPLSLKWLEDYRVYITKKRSVNAQNGAQGGRPSKKKGIVNPSLSTTKSDGLAKANPLESTYARKPEAEAEAEVEAVVEEEVEECNPQDGVQGKDPGKTDYPATGTNALAAEPTPAPPSTKPPRRPRPHIDSRVLGLIDHLKAAIGKNLDGSLNNNEDACALLLQRFEQEAPTADPVQKLKDLIAAGVKDPFHGKNITDFGYLYRHAGKIITATSTAPTGRQTPTEKAAATIQQRANRPPTLAEHLAQKDPAPNK